MIYAVDSIDVELSNQLHLSANETSHEAPVSEKAVFFAGRDRS